MNMVTNGSYGTNDAAERSYPLTEKYLSYKSFLVLLPVFPALCPDVYVFSMPTLLE